MQTDRLWSRVGPAVGIDTVTMNGRMKAHFFSQKADYIGITGSVLCLIHCIATPFLLLTSSVLRENNTIQAGFLSLDYVFIGVNIVAVYFATRHQTIPAIRMALWCFLVLFTVALLLEDRSPVFEYLGYAASLGLVTTHLANIRYCRTRHSH
jgi:hypothetical protein